MVGKTKELIRWLLEQPEEKKWKIAECKPKRSLNANAYFWVLVDKIAKSLHEPSADIHNKLLSENLCFMYEDETIKWMTSPRKPDRFGLLKEGNAYWYDSGRIVFMHKPNGEPYMNGDKKQTARIYLRVKGSHEMDTSEMSRLIEGTVMEARELDIETMTPDELKRMMAAWKPRREDETL